MIDNLLLMSDSYKYSMYNQYPPNTQNVFSYIEARGGLYDKLVFFGLQAFIKRYIQPGFTNVDIQDAVRTMGRHGLPFYYEGWDYILKTYNGHLPVIIRSIDEGTVIEPGNVLVTIENLDEKCWWLPTFLETALLRAIWYPTTVASNSYHSKQIILNSLIASGDPSTIEYKLHDFGARGVSSHESAQIGGAAHLINFTGSDTVEAIEFIKNYYFDYGRPDYWPFTSKSIPAMEHSTVTSWGRDGEEESFRNMLKQYGEPGGIMACVSDSYDIYAACKLWGTKLKQDVIDSGATLVVRPDSGDPAQVITKCAKLLDKYFGHTVNEKGFKVLNNVRLIQGDGINHASIKSILFSLTLQGYSADNIAFGQGGALLQAVDRDTCKFAMKCSAINVDGEWRDVFKDPITDPGKKSKKGRLKLIKDENNKFQTVRVEEPGRDLLRTRYVNGVLMNTTQFTEIRNRAKINI